MKLRYKNFVANVDWRACTQIWHDRIWEFHQELEAQGIPHIFFNGNNDFSTVPNQYNWGASYIAPYNPKSTYDTILKQNNYQTVAPNSWHFGQEAHSFWANYMLQYIVRNQLM